tara:strand:- start:2677 stop:3099 length:423 start_codon:yes stop_codon:yes gene_type:complete
MTKAKKKTPTAKQIEAARKKLSELQTQRNALNEEISAMRHKMADHFLPEEVKNHGSKTVKMHGVAITVNRKLTITCNKEQQQQFQADAPDLYDQFIPSVAVRVLNETESRKNLDQIDRWVTTKQGLPEIKFKDLEEDAQS